MSDVETARRIEHEARAAVAKIEADAREIGQNAERDARFSLGIEAAREGVKVAIVARMAAENQLPPHEWDGRRVFRMRNVGRGYGPQYVREEGVVETRYHSTVFPANVGSYSMPRLGEGFVRLIKKNGTVGSKFAGLRDWQLADAPTPSQVQS